MTAGEPSEPRGRRWLGRAFVAWAVLGLFTAPVVEAVGSRLGAPFPCGLCSAGWCEHRALGHGLLHVLGAAGLWFAWLRAARDTAPVGGWRTWVAAAVPVVLLVSTLLERLVDVETVMATGVIIGVAGLPLVAPSARPWARAMGWVSLVTAMVGYDMVVLWQLSPAEARDPLFVTGLLGFAASVVVAIVAAVRESSRAPEADSPAPVSSGDDPS